jgi:flagellar biosynthesis protein FlhA
MDSMAASTSPIAGSTNLPPPPAAPGAKPRGAKTSDQVRLSSFLPSDIPWGDLAVPVSVLGVVLAMITPLPAFALDLLIALNMALSVIVLLVGMYIARPVEFSVFPTTLLLMTLFRLALNISSSRLILLNGNTGTAAAGHVIEAFGNFVVGGNYIIGAVIFLVLIAIQYVVINHGAVRISEVTARFTLDALPGKQMSIDADLNAGLIDEAEARTRRKQLSAEAEFYGAMDGASRFTQRDAVASILITGINIIAGFLIGVLQHGMELARALQTYTVLTIGDGLVTVIPALMISVCGGMIVTRASSDTRLSTDFRRQILNHHQPITLAGGVILLLAFFPGLPAIPFLLLGGGISYVAWTMRQKFAASRKLAAQATPAPAREQDNLESLLKVEPLAIEVGLGLVRLVEGGQGSPLLRRIAGIRRQIASELGYLLPPVRLTDNLSLKVGEYVILQRGIEIARFEIPQGCEMAIHPEGTAETLAEAIPTLEPAFGLKAWWIPSRASDHARQLGYTVVDPVSLLGTHLAETVKRQAHELLSRQDTKKILDRVAEENPKIVEDLVPKLLPLSLVQKVLQNLLRERVSVRDGGSILESLGEGGQITKNSVLLTEYVRQGIRRAVVQPYLSPAGELPAYFLDPGLEQIIEQAIEHGEHASHLQLPPQRIREIVDRIARKVSESTGKPGAGPVVTLCSSPVRHFLRQMLEPSLRNVQVLAHGEVPPGVKVLSLGVIA